MSEATWQKAQAAIRNVREAIAIVEHMQEKARRAERRAIEAKIRAYRAKVAAIYARAEG